MMKIIAVWVLCSVIFGPGEALAKKGPEKIKLAVGDSQVVAKGAATLTFVGAEYGPATVALSCDDQAQEPVDLAEGESTAEACGVVVQCTKIIRSNYGKTKATFEVNAAAHLDTGQGEE